MEEGAAEPHALYKLMLFSRTSCLGKLGCAGKHAAALRADILKLLARVIAAEMQSYNERVTASASTREYELGILPARQMCQVVGDASFSEKQQRQSRYDGGVEAYDVTANLSRGAKLRRTRRRFA